MAEREGFEPPIALRLCLISSQVHSTGRCHLSVFVCYTARCLLEAFCPLLAVSMALTPPEARSTAPCLCFRLRSAFGLVISAVRRPRSSPTVYKSTPAITSLPAKVWRLQCHV